MYNFDTRTQTRYASYGMESIRYTFRDCGAGLVPTSMALKALLELATLHVQSNTQAGTGVWFRYKPSDWIANGFPIRRATLARTIPKLDDVLIVREGSPPALVVNPLRGSCGVARESLYARRIAERDALVFNQTLHDVPEMAIMNAAAFYVLGHAGLDFIHDIDRQQWFANALWARIIDSVRTAFPSQSFATVGTALEACADARNTESLFMQWYALCPGHVKELHAQAFVADVAAAKRIRQKILQDRNMRRGEAVDSNQPHKE